MSESKSLSLSVRHLEAVLRQTWGAAEWNEEFVEEGITSGEYQYRMGASGILTGDIQLDHEPSDDLNGGTHEELVLK